MKKSLKKVEGKKSLTSGSHLEFSAIPTKLCQNIGEKIEIEREVN